MLKVSPIGNNYINFMSAKKASSQKQLSLKMNQEKIMTIGVMSLSLGVIRSVDVFRGLKSKTNNVKHPMLQALFAGAVAAGCAASFLSLFQIRYSDKT